MLRHNYLQRKAMKAFLRRLNDRREQIDLDFKNILFDAFKKALDDPEIVEMFRNIKTKKQV
jgi:hypothetical protein